MEILTGLWLAFKASKPLQYILAGVLVFVSCVIIGLILNSWYIGWRKEQTRIEQQANRADVLLADQEVRAAEKREAEIKAQSDATLVEIKAAEEATKEAKAKHLEAIEKDSGEFSPEFEINRKRFCELYEGDSRCLN